MEKVLVIDDQKELHATYQRLLNALGFTNITFAANYSEGVKAEASNPIDWFLSDWDLGDGNGPDLMDNIAQNRPVVIMTGFQAQEKIERIAQSGYGYLPKPFGLEQLREVLKKQGIMQ